MSEEMYHSIFYQCDGGTLAHEIKAFFARRRYNIQFNLHKLQDADTKKASISGVSILLITPESCDFIQSGKCPDLNTLFPNPDFSVAILFQVDKSQDEIGKLLTSRAKDSHRWTLFEYRSGSGLSALGVHIIHFVEKLDGNSLPSPSLRKFQVWLPEEVKPHHHVILIFNKPVDDDSKVKVIQEWDGVNGEAQRLNCMTHSFIIGDVKPGKRNIEVFVNDVSYGKATLHVHCVETNMEQITKLLLHDVINPVQLLSQCLHIVPENRQDLDTELAQLFSTDKSSVSNIFDKLDFKRLADSKSKSELPTLLHFGAKYGFIQFCMQLMKLPGSQHILTMKNKDGLLPRDLARKGGFDDLAVFLQKTEEGTLLQKTDEGTFLQTTNEEEGIQIQSKPPLSQEDTESDDTFVSATHHDERPQIQFSNRLCRGPVSPHSKSLLPGRHGNTLGGSRFCDVLEREDRINQTGVPISMDTLQISPDYTAHSRRMTDMTGNVNKERPGGRGPNVRRNQSMPASARGFHTCGKITKKERPYDLPSDTP